MLYPLNALSRRLKFDISVAEDSLTLEESVYVCH